MIAEGWTRRKCLVQNSFGFLSRPVKQHLLAVSLFRTCITSSKTRSSTYLQARPPAISTHCYAIQVEKNTGEAALFQTYKPITPGIRHLELPLNEHLYEGRVRLLTIAKCKTGGRNAHGKVTIRHRGGGHRQRIRTDFMHEESGVYVVVRIECDPGRSAGMSSRSS